MHQSGLLKGGNKNLVAMYAYDLHDSWTGKLLTCRLEVGPTTWIHNAVTLTISRRRGNIFQNTIWGVSQWVQWEE
jgi:hypothetical protein